MPKIKNVRKLTENKYLNLYEIEAINKKNDAIKYFIASRKSKDKLALYGNYGADAVTVYGIYGVNRDKIVLVKQYRFAIDDFMYELPAGLINDGETIEIAGKREFKEETGLDFHVAPVSNVFTQPYYTSSGMSDESIAIIYGYADGEISYKGLEDDEDLEIIIADKKEVVRILTEEKVATMCMLMLQKFLMSNKDNVLDFTINDPGISKTLD